MSDVELIMVTPKEVAEKLGLSRQAVSRQLRKILKQHEIPVERDGRGRVLKFSLADFEHYKGEFSNPQQSQSPKQSPTAPAANSRDEALRQTAWLDLRKRELQYQAECGALVRADYVAETIENLGKVVQATINRLSNKADDLAITATKNGVNGLRAELKEISFQMCSDIDKQLANLENEAADKDKWDWGEQSE